MRSIAFLLLAACSTAPHLDPFPLETARAVAQWMDGPPAEAMADLAREGMTFPWGTDYTVGAGGGVCADAWRSVGGMVLP